MKEMKFLWLPAQKHPLARLRKLGKGQSIPSISSTYSDSPLDENFEIYPVYAVE